VRLRSIRPPSDPLPNDNDPADVPPATVGPPAVTPGDPDGVQIDEGVPFTPLARVMASAWSGWPADWYPPAWNSGGGTGQQAAALSDTAWMCIDLNASILSTMPPYLVSAAPSLDAAWMTNPNPDTYTSWEEFAKQVFWDYQLGEAFILCTARYASGWPARFHVVPPWSVEVELDAGIRRYTIGSQQVDPEDMLHIRYKSRADWPRGQGPLDVGAGYGQVIADRVLSRYAQSFANAGGVPSSILTHDDELTAAQAEALQTAWVQARQSKLGEPAVLSGGVSWQPTQMNPRDMALVELSDRSRGMIAQMLGVPAPLVGIPVCDPQTYRNVKNFFDFHWRSGLRPKAQAVMAALSAWALPAGTTVELNRDAYIEPEPLERAQVAQIYNAIRDPQGNPVLSVDEIRAAERMQVAGAAGIPPPVAPESAGA
jgi:HK97 family phage portal protein